MKITRKNKKNIYVGLGVAVVLVGGFFAYKKGLINSLLNLFKKKES